MYQAPDGEYLYSKKIVDEYGLNSLQELDNKLLKLSILKTRNNEAFKSNHDTAFEYFLYQELGDLFKNIAAIGQTKGFQYKEAKLSITPLDENTFYFMGGRIGMLEIDFSGIVKIKDNRVQFEGSGLRKINMVFGLSFIFGIGAFKDPELKYKYSEWNIADTEILNYMNIFVDGLKN